MNTVGFCINKNLDQINRIMQTFTYRKLENARPQYTEFSWMFFLIHPHFLFTEKHTIHVSKHSDLQHRYRMIKSLRSNYFPHIQNHDLHLVTEDTLHPYFNAQIPFSI